MTRPFAKKQPGLSHATLNTNVGQIRYLVEQGCIAPLCSMLSSQVATATGAVLRGLINILKMGEEDLEDSPSRINLISILIEGAGGVERIKALRNHDDEQIQEWATKTFEALYGCAEIEEDPRSLYHQHVAALVAASSFDVNETRVTGGLLPLHYTVRHEDVPCLEMLLGMDGANVNLLDGKNGMPLHVATAHGHARCIELLLAAGADGVDSGEESEEEDGVADETAENLPEMVLDILSEDPAMQLQGTVRIQKLLSIDEDGEDPTIQPVVDDGRVVPRLVEFLRGDYNPKLQYQAAWALTNIANGTTLQTQIIVERGVVPVLVRILSSRNALVRCQAVWALGNIAGDSVEHRDLVLGANALPPLLELLSKDDCPLEMQRQATRTLSNLCRTKPHPLAASVAPALPTLATLIANSKDDEVVEDACRALSHLSDGPNEQIQVVIEDGVCLRLVELLTHSSS